jgi:hypothetical protein
MKLSLLCDVCSHGCAKLRRLQAGVHPERHAEVPFAHAGDYKEKVAGIGRAT